MNKKIFVIMMSIISYVFPQTKQIGVVNFNSFGISADQVVILSDGFRNNLKNTGSIKVIASNLISKRLESMNLSYTECIDKDCLQKVGLDINADYMIGGTIGKIGTSYTIVLTFIDVQADRVLETFSENPNVSMEGLLKVFEEIANRIATKYLKKSSRRIENKINLKINSNPYDAKVFINSNYIGRTPIELSDMKKGELHIRFEKSNYKAYSKKITLSKSEIINVKLEKTSLRLKVFSSPKNAKVYLNDKYIGKTPLYKSLKKGIYKIRIEKNKYKIWKNTISLANDFEVIANLEYNTEYLKNKKAKMGEITKNVKPKMSKSFLLAYTGGILISGIVLYLLFEEKINETKNNSKTLPSPPSRP